MYIINSKGIAYHQHEVLYIIKPTDLYTLKRDEIQGRKPALDDIHLASRGDDMPSLSAWINKKHLHLQVFFVGGGSGIRTHAPFRTNGFQDRLVMTTSISLRILTVITVKIQIIKL